MTLIVPVFHHLGWRVKGHWQTSWSRPHVSKTYVCLLFLDFLVHQTHNNLILVQHFNSGCIAPVLSFQGFGPSTMYGLQTLLNANLKCHHLHIPNVVFPAECWLIIDFVPDEIICHLYPYTPTVILGSVTYISMDASVVYVILLGLGSG